MKLIHFYSLLMIATLATYYYLGAYSLWFFLVPAVIIRGAHILWSQYCEQKKMLEGVRS